MKDNREQKIKRLRKGSQGVASIHAQFILIDQMADFAAMWSLPQETANKHHTGYQKIKRLRKGSQGVASIHAQFILIDQMADFAAMWSLPHETANKHHTGYQKIIRNLLDQHSEYFSGRV